MSDLPRPRSASDKRMAGHLAGGHVAFGTVIAAVGFCCATSLFGVAVVSGAIAAAIGSIAGL